MKVYETKDVRNIALVGHFHAGKTQLASALLYTAGAVNRLTRPDEGNAVTDYDEEEMQRKLSISSSVAATEWNKSKVNIIDTPGFSLFLQDARSAMIAADAVAIVIDGVNGAEVGAEKGGSNAEEVNVGQILVVNKLDRERSNFDNAVNSIHEVFGRTAIPVHLPIGSEKNFNGLVDLITMKSYTYGANGDGKGKEGEIPADMAEAAKAGHEALVEMVAEGNDELMEEFFNEGTLPIEHIAEGLQAAIRERRIFPILCAAGGANIGVDRILSFAVDYLPSPDSRGPVHAQQNGKEIELKVSDTGSPAVYVFKTSADPFAGRVTYFKVLCGSVKNDDHLLNGRSNADERLSHLSVPLGKQQVNVPQLHAGDIGVVAKLRDTLTGDTLAAKGTSISFPKVQIPEPSIAYAIEAKSRNDEDRMSNALQKILEEDLQLRFYRDPQTHEFLLAGAGQQHVEMIVSKLKKRYNVEVALHEPKIAYRETIRGRADVQGRHKKQTGGHGQFGDCWIRMEPLERGAKFQFANEVFGGSIPKNFIPAIEKGILEAAGRGYLAGFPVVDFKVTVYDGSYHDVDSSEMAFKIAARKAFKAAMESAKPTLLEPIMQVEVQAPVEFAGDLMGDLNGRRGRISGMETKGGTQVVRAQVPMAEMLSYQNELTSMTQGRGSFHMEFDHYDYVPQPNAEKIIAAAKATHVGGGEEEE